MNLSIIVVNYNTKELLKKCVDSLINGLKDSKINGLTEVIVVDNASTDGSVETIKRLTDSKINGLTIRLIENKENLGFAKAVNQALRQVYTEPLDFARDKLRRSAQGKVILLLNSDTVVKKDALSELLKFEEKIGPAIVGARLLNADGSIQASVFHLPTVKRAIEEFWFNKKDAFSKYIPGGNGPVEVEAVVGGAMLISRSVIEKVGVFDERYFMYFEDLDYCRRAKKAGFKVYYLPAAEIIHEHGASGKTLVKKENQWKRLLPSSKRYHGFFKHFSISLILWSGQKLKKVLK